MPEDLTTTPGDLAEEVLDAVHAEVQFYGPGGIHANKPFLDLLRPFLLPLATRAIAAESIADALGAAIRRHRDYRGDDRCHLDDEELYRALPEGYTPPPRDTAVELERCRQYIACRHNPGTEYVSPQRRIEEIEARLREFGAKADVVGCAFCGFACRKSDPDIVSKLAGHMQECARHPMAAALRENDDLRARLASALDRLAVQSDLLAGRDAAPSSLQPPPPAGDNGPG